MNESIPPNVHISTHPCLQAKLSQLRSSEANTRETKALVNEISLIIGCEATAAGLTVSKGPTVCVSIHPFIPPSPSIFFPSHCFSISPPQPN